MFSVCRCCGKMGYFFYPHYFYLCILCTDEYEAVLRNVQERWIETTPVFREEAVD